MSDDSAVGAAIIATVLIIIVAFLIGFVAYNIGSDNGIDRIKHSCEFAQKFELYPGTKNSKVYTCSLEDN